MAIFKQLYQIQMMIRNNNIMERHINQLSLNKSLSFTSRFTVNIFYNSRLPINNRLPFRRVLPFRRHSVSWRKGAYMRRLINFVSMQWHAYRWHKTLLGRERDFWIANLYLKLYCRVPNLWRPGDLYLTQRILSTRWTPGSILSALSNQEATRASRRFRQTPAPMPENQGTS